MRNWQAKGIEANVANMDSQKETIDARKNRDIICCVMYQTYDINIACRRLSFYVQSLIREGYINETMQ